MIVAGLGAVLIGAIYTGYSHVGVTAFVPRVLMFAAIGAVVAAIIWNVARARFGSREVYTPRSSY